MTNSNHVQRVIGSLKQCKLWAIALLIGGNCLTEMSAQNQLPRAYKSYDLKMATDASDNNKSAVVSEYIIEEKGAIWLRIFFDQVQLNGNSTITLTSLLDNASQTFNAHTISKWQNSSAYFNGDKVKVTITENQGENSSLRINKIGIGKKNNLQTKSQCGAQDNRIASNDAAIGRIEPIGCTGWIITNGRLVTAGHCASSRASLILFNVPRSQANGTRVFPGPEDQYPITSMNTQYVRGRAETDWAVFTAGANTQTGLTPIQAQNKFFNVVRSNPIGPITITGFGTDTGADNATQQTHTGPLASFDNTFVRYTTDTERGNSGSPIIDVATGNAVGVHAYGGCNRSGGGSNSGERSTIPAFWQAMGLSNTTPPDENCDNLTFNAAQVSSFANQDSSGDFGIVKNRRGISLRNNTWKTIPFSYQITSQTILEVTFSSTSEGEVHAIGFESDNDLSPTLYFKLYGTQNYGVADFDNYSGSSERVYRIPVGQFYTGTASTMIFINDNDAGSGNTSVFSNIKVYEGSCGNINTTVTRASGTNLYEEKGVVIGNEDENQIAVQRLTISPNPVSDQFELFIKDNKLTNAIIYTLSGQKHSEVQLQPGANTFSAKNMDLTTGMYLIEMYGANGFTEVKKLIINN
ncbi:trypsin-like peptidase domain-containing protein [Aquimarina sp. ERC-38]|uniref:trypsin-like peptidase domain-containing protein n=1 Tax=Aquimarina sp. ERC-38 TaxID=2949996 RepID=UPI002246A308|nr:trypsin-like peptidase domain-containing protein [Aquimarina sp. ERC-38]UZO79464.1 trypsin-like peptidase domain-containing protein [Aquimarina sp. ERC-38]